MRDALLRLTGVLAVAGAVVAASGSRSGGLHPANPEAPPAGRTGGFGEPTCTECHIGNDVNAFGGRVRIEGVGDRYAPGESHVLTVVMDADETVLAGFQLSARFQSGEEVGQPAGTLRSVDDRTGVIRSETGQPYAQHTPAGTAVATSYGSSWTVEWTAPAAEKVVFHVVATSGNGDNSPLGDLVFASSRQAHPEANHHPTPENPVAAFSPPRRPLDWIPSLLRKANLRPAPDTR